MKIIYSFLFVIAVIMTSCSKGEKMKKVEPELPGPTNANEAQESNDQKSGGIYKGALVGTVGSGAVIITLQNNSARATVLYNGGSTELTANTGSWTSGQAMKDVVFSGQGMTLTFTVNADGSNPVVVITIPAQILFATVIKETSTNKVQVFEGTYIGNGGQSGIINFTVSGNIMLGVGKGTFTDAENVVQTVHTSISGTRTGNNISGIFLEIGPGGKFNGTINGTNASGTFEQKLVEGDKVLIDSKGTWTAKQTRTE